MIMDHDDLIWQKLSSRLFGRRPMTDEGLFTFRVMDQVRRLKPEMEVLAWHRFLRWAVPMLGAGVAGLILAARAPSTSSLMDNALFHQQPDISGSLSSAIQGNE
jgi:hypothetical protein